MAEAREESTKDIERRQFQEEAKILATNIIDEMNKRSDQDKHNVENKKPALEKLQYLSQLSSHLESVHHR